MQTLVLNPNSLHQNPIQAPTKVFEIKDSSKPESKKQNRNFLNSIHNFTNHKFANPALILANLVSAGVDLFIENPILKTIVSKGSELATKAMMMLRDAETAVAALEQNRIIESAGRLLGIISLPLVKLHDLTLASGLGEFIPQIDLSLEGKLGKDRKYTSYSENFTLWQNAFLGQIKETFQAGFGKDRKILTQGKDKGHTLTLAGVLTFFGAGLGVALGRSQRNFWNKLGGSIRTAGSLLADYTLITHPDKKMNSAGYVFLIASVVDFIQRFLPEKYLKTINHINIVNTLVGRHIMTNRTHQKNNQDLEVY